MQQLELPSALELHDGLRSRTTWDERFAYLLTVGDAAPTLPESLRTPDRLIPGCSSRLWLHCDPSPDAVTLITASDSRVIQALATTLVVFYDGHSLAAARDLNLSAYLIDLGLVEYLTPQRDNGFRSLMREIRKQLGI